MNHLQIKPNVLLTIAAVAVYVIGVFAFGRWAVCSEGGRVNRKEHGEIIFMMAVVWPLVLILGAIWSAWSFIVWGGHPDADK
jgi:Kef-type K+ transport system membrane component KefB